MRLSFLRELFILKKDKPENYEMILMKNRLIILCLKHSPFLRISIILQGFTYAHSLNFYLNNDEKRLF